VKVNFPKPDMRKGVKPQYDAEFSAQQAVDAVVASANRTLVRQHDESLRFVARLREVLAKYPR
jgi:fructose-bisphosphate aldolase, class I